MESLSNKGKRCFIHENKFRSYRKDQHGNEYTVLAMHNKTTHSQLV